MQVLASLLLLIFNASRAIGQTTHNVTVGFKGSFYDPPTITALEGDTVTFIFAGQLHGVTQSSFSEPCSPLPGGFSSGLVGLNGSTDISPPTWNLIVSNISEPIWFFCQSTKPLSHCAAGMVGAINASPDQYEQFASAAKVVTGTPKPTLSVALTGMGAFATVSPTTVLQPDSTASGTDGSDSESDKSIPVGAIAGGVVGGVVVVAIIILLLFLLYRQTNNKTIIEGRNLAGEKERTPSTPLFKNGISQSITRSGLVDSEASRVNGRMRHQASSSALSSDLESTTREVPSVIDISNNNKIQAQNSLIPNSQHGHDTVTMADAFNLSPTRHPYSQAQAQSQAHYNQQPLPPPIPLVTMPPDQFGASIHEIAKEVAALFRSGNALPPGLSGPSPPPVALPVVDSRFAQSRVPRQLPNPTHYLRPAPVLEEPGSPALPRYER